MKTVFYYTSAYFLDTSIEIINAIKDKVALHVFIEITPSSKITNIIEVKDFTKGEYLASPESVLNKENYEMLSPYFKGCQSVQFVIHHHASGLSVSTVKTNMAVNRLIKRLKPAVIHFEGFTLRTMGLLPWLLKRKKIILSIHDAVLHSGEKTWKSSLPRFCFLKLSVPKSYVFYSAFTKNEFINEVSHSKGDIVQLQMHAFSLYRKMIHTAPAYNHILFFGRISRYKGVPFLLDAMPIVWNEFPEVKLVIAGSGSLPEITNHQILKNNSDKIIFHNRHIPNAELVGLINEAMLIVCPYTDATQSGVLMTTFGLNKPVVATNVGAFKEFIKPGVNGYLAEKSDPESIADAIKKSLFNNNYLQLEKNLKESPESAGWQTNGELLLEAYQTN